MFLCFCGTKPQDHDPTQTKNNLVSAPQTAPEWRPKVWLWRHFGVKFLVGIFQSFPIFGRWPQNFNRWRQSFSRGVILRSEMVKITQKNIICERTATIQKTKT